MKRLLIPLILLSACASRSTQKKQLSENASGHPHYPHDTILPFISLKFAQCDSAGNAANTAVIKKSMAIPIVPDSDWISEQQNMLGGDDWNEVVSDNSYYQSEAFKVLEEKGIEVYAMPNNKRFLRFMLSYNNTFIIDKQNMKDKWGIILFSNDTLPVFWNGTSVQEAIKALYKK
jgi:hypothetical protein